MKIFLGIASVLLLLGACFQCGVTVGHSMEPTLKSGQVFLMARAYGGRLPIHTGDVVAFAYGGAENVKRVAAVGGETLRVPVIVITGYRAVQRICNGVRTEHWVDVSYRSVKRIKVPQGQLFVVGDNPEHSEDSRTFGCIPLASVHGRLLLSRSGMRVARHALTPIREIKIPDNASSSEHHAPGSAAPVSSPASEYISLDKSRMRRRAKLLGQGKA